MSFENGKKGITYGFIAIICWVISLLSNLFSIPYLGAIAGILVLVFGILAYAVGKQEYAADPANTKAKSGKIIGLAIIILEIVSVILSYAFLGLAISITA